MKELTVGIIGGGGFFELVHAPALNLMPGIKRKVLHRRDAEKAKVTCAKWGYDAFYQDFDEMCKKEKPDCILCVTPPNVTKDFAVRAITAGIPVMLEKPVARDFAGLNEIKLAYEKYKTPHFVAYNRRHISILNEGKKYAEARGGLSHLAVDFFREDRTAPAALMGSGVHAIDALRYLCGDVAEIYTITSKTQYFDKKNISYSSLLTFESGISGVFNYNCRAGVCSERYGLFTENGTVFIELSNPGDIQYPKNLKIYEMLNLVKEVDFNRDLPKEQQTAWHFNGIVDEQIYFLDCIRNKKKMEPDIYESIRTTRLAEAINVRFNGKLKDFSIAPIEEF